MQALADFQFSSVLGAKSGGAKQQKHNKNLLERERENNTAYQCVHDLTLCTDVRYTLASAAQSMANATALSSSRTNSDQYAVYNSVSLFEKKIFFNSNFSVPI